ncbi:ABC transporter permease subunit [Paenibacillus doosanensis]|uniref:Multiple-sugar transport system permease YteP n=1 Tax=Paenibacillus konkukensis TaxID=2020716 RepID=A0ABY4RP02_9BACL|nr:MULTISPECIES: ABC transporter permease subunit [Paenibacillus]MCS7459119.1 ABC transporter permease subunit [Paenibacillus doosanensis]UQZ84174.1 putative multiple-sugar transport system permease YteP [Paenibacillus konkukensis]
MRGAGVYLNRYWQLYAMLLLPIAYFLVFKYGPMYGVTIAFKDFNLFQGINKSPWIGFDTFRQIFKMDAFYVALRNTFMLNILDLIFSFPAPILLALMLNELSAVWFKKLSQTILYLPHFISWVIIGGIVYQAFSTNSGVVNHLLGNIGIGPIPFLSDKYYWLITYLGTGIWQSAGWGTIIYLAALTAINKELYEAADVDGAGRFAKIWNITLPGIRSTIIVLLILKLGEMVQIGFDRPFVIGNVTVAEFSQVLSTFVYKMGMQTGEYSVATAVGFFQAVVGLVFILTSNYISKKTTDEGIL